MRTCWTEVYQGHALNLWGITVKRNVMLLPPGGHNPFGIAEARSVTRSTSARCDAAKSPVPSALAKLLRLPESRSASASTGLRPEAQGCRNAAILGHRSTNPPTATRLRPICWRSFHLRGIQLYAGSTSVVPNFHA